MTKRLLIAAVCLLVGVLSGCAALDSKPDAEPASTPEWLENLKSLSNVGTTTGVSREAREIEKRLGTR